MDVHRQSLARDRSGRALDAVDIRCVIAERNSLRMVLIGGDTYWVSRRLDNTASSHAGALWIIYSSREGTCSIVANDSGQDDCP